MVVGRKKSSLKRPGQQPQQAQNGISVVASSEADVVDGGVIGAANGAHSGGDGVNSGNDVFRYGQNSRFEHHLEINY